MSNYPPGVSDNMIPGNRPEDAEWEALLESIDSDMQDMYIDQAKAIWEMGKASWYAMKKHYKE